MATRRTAICLSSDSDNENLVTSARREAARRATTAQEQKLREESYERDVAAAHAVGTGPEAVKKPVVSDAQMQQLVSSYRRHFGDHCADRAKRNKYLTQYFPYVVWEKVPTRLACVHWWVSICDSRVGLICGSLDVGAGV